MTVNLKLKQQPEENRQTIKLLDPIEKAQQNPKSLRRAINAYCYDCCCEQKSEVRLCSALNCPFYHLRPWQPKEI